MRRLFHLPLSPFSRKVRLVLGEKRIETELVEELPWDRRIDFLRLNPAGEVPVFIDENGGTICDSNAICEFLEETGPTPRLLPSDATDRAEARRLVGWFDAKLRVGGRVEHCPRSRLIAVILVVCYASYMRHRLVGAHHGQACSGDV